MTYGAIIIEHPHLLGKLNEYVIFCTFGAKDRLCITDEESRLALL
jgi:hypothetical protein